MDATSNATVKLFPVPQKYDPDEFITASTDSKGHDSRFWFRGPAGLARQIEIILAARRFPYKTQSDVLRHALVRHLAWLGTLEPDVESVMGQVEVVLNLLRDEQYHQDFMAMFEELAKTVHRYLSGGHNGEAMRTVARCRDTLEKMPEGFWRDEYLKELEKRFGYLLKGSGASLVVKPAADYQEGGE